MSFLIKHSKKEDPKVQLKKKYTVNFMKIRIFALQKTLLRRWKDKPQTGRK